jgi:F-type H+-transporting ATPase subunit epsilon
MAAETLLLQLVSPERLLVEEQVDEVQIPALDGFIGVMPGSAPLLSELKPGGVVTYHAPGGHTRVFAVYGGFVEVLPDRVRILADSAQPAEEIDQAAAQKRFEAANRALTQGGGEASDPSIALAEAMRAQAAVDAAATARK